MSKKKIQTEKQHWKNGFAAFICDQKPDYAVSALLPPHDGGSGGYSAALRAEGGMSAALLWVGECLPPYLSARQRAWNFILDCAHKTHLPPIKPPLFTNKTRELSPPTARNKKSPLTWTTFGGLLCALLLAFVATAEGDGRGGGEAGGGGGLSAAWALSL
jgi:hypothetical protein